MSQASTLILETETSPQKISGLSESWSKPPNRGESQWDRTGNRHSAARRLPCQVTRGVVGGMRELGEDSGTHSAMFAEPDSPGSCHEDSCFRGWDGAALVSFWELGGDAEGVVTTEWVVSEETRHTELPRGS